MPIVGVPADFLTVAQAWQSVISHRIGEFVSDAKKRHPLLNLVEPQKVFRGERNSSVLNDVNHWAVVLFWNGTTLVEEMDQAEAIDAWTLGVSAAVRQDRNSPTRAFDHMMAYTVALRLLIQSEIRKIACGELSPQFLDVSAYQTVKAITFINGQQLEDAPIGDSVFKQGTLNIQHRIITF